MSETTDKPKLGTRAPLGLKRTVEAGKVKQSFSHGRSNTVVVEVKKRRVLGRPGEAAPTQEVAAPPPPPALEGDQRAPVRFVPVRPSTAPKRPEPSRPTRGREDRRERGKLTVTRAL